MCFRNWGGRGLAVEASKRSAAQSLINHTPSSNTASIRFPGAAVGAPPAGVALEERGAEGSSVVRVQVSKLLREAGREDRAVAVEEAVVVMVVVAVVGTM